MGTVPCDWAPCDLNVHFVDVVNFLLHMHTVRLKIYPKLCHCAYTALQYKLYVVCILNLIMFLHLHMNVHILLYTGAYIAAKYNIVIYIQIMNRSKSIYCHQS